MDLTELSLLAIYSRVTESVNNQESKTVRKVITYGVFDVFHEGHRRLLERAKDLGDYLIVGVTDNLFDELRGKLDTVDSLQVRMANVLATGYVDEVIVEDHDGQKSEDITRLGIDVFAIGSDWRGKFDYLRPLCEVVYLDRTKGVSSTQIRANRFHAVKIGIIGSGRIARRFVPEARAAKHVDIQAVFNPHLSSAEVFQSQFKLPLAIDNLEEFFSTVEAVYIASPHETHEPYARLALEAGKHVLAEKPLALSETAAESLFELAEKNGLVLLEAVKTAYAPGFCKLISLAQSGIIGNLVDIESSFTRLTPSGCRERDDALYGGSVLELGSYVILPALRLFGCNPNSVRFDSVRDNLGLDVFTKVHLDFGNRFAMGKVGLGAKSEGNLIITGTNGYIVVKAPWWKPRHIEVHFEDPSHVERFEYAFAGEGLRYEISEFTHRIRGHEGRMTKLSVEESIGMARIIGQFLAQEQRPQ